MFKIRTITGICFQQDVLFPMLTVREHVVFFGIVKGISLSKIKQEAKDLIIEVGLHEKIDTVAVQLSGGQKRKLCLACALIGNPKFLIIDECTSGMDPSARRNTWDVLLKRKQGSVILLSTHYMWEADFLGDRIAVISDGVLLAMGSSLFLKSSLGDGYVLTLSKESESSCNVKKIKELINDILPKSKLSQIVAGEITFRLDLQETEKFPDMLASLQSKAKDLGIVIIIIIILIIIIHNIIKRNWKLWNFINFT
jgi:ABC-type multidrug transport system ATPase subunit